MQPLHNEEQRKKIQNTTTVRTILKSLNAMSVAGIFFVPICVNCVYCVNCIKFGQLILRIIIKIDATRCQILRLKCTKIVFGGPEPAARAYDAPGPPSRLGVDRRLGRLHSRAFGTRLSFAVPSLCPWRRFCLRLLCKLHKIWSVDSQDNH